MAVINPNGCNPSRAITKAASNILDGKGNPVLLGIEGINSYNVTIYPNPATNQLSIETNTLNIEEINIFNTSGELVIKIRQLQNKTIDISQLASGAYIAEIKTKEGSIRKRWVKM